MTLEPRARASIEAMAPKATLYHLLVNVSDVERNFYERLDLRLARHPSESLRYLVTRALAYCLEYRPGIAFSKGGVSSRDEAPLSIRDDTGTLLAWIDIGSPAAERMHKAAKAAERVAIYTHAELDLLRREAASRTVYRLEEIEVFRFEAEFLDELGQSLEATSSWELVRTDSRLYVSVRGVTIEGGLQGTSLTVTAR